MKKGILGILALLLFTFGGFAADLEATVTDTSPGENNGEIDLDVNGGASPFVYDWSGPGGFTSSDEDLSGLEVGSYTVTVTDLYCGIATLIITVVEGEVDNSSIDEEKEPFAVSLYPNPTTGLVYLTSNDPIDIMVFNVLGEVVLSANQVTEFNLSGNPDGIYMIQVRSERGVLTRKITLL